MTDASAPRLHAIAGETSLPPAQRGMVGVVASLLGAAVSASRGPHEAFADEVAVGRQVAA